MRTESKTNELIVRVPGLAVSIVSVVSAVSIVHVVSAVSFVPVVSVISVCLLTSTLQIFIRVLSSV
jgi:hypothetical protein